MFTVDVACATSAVRLRPRQSRIVIMNEGAQVRNLFLVNEGEVRAKGGVYLENATKNRTTLTGSGVRGEEERHSAWDLDRGYTLGHVRRLQRLQREASNASSRAVHRATH